MNTFFVDEKSLPRGNNEWFHSEESNFPLPNQIREQSVCAEGNPTQALRAPPFIVPHLGLIVKWGLDVTIAEGQCLWFLSNHMSDYIPVPRIYGWKQDADQTFLYMELIDGDSLESRWANLSSVERSSISTQLRNMIESLQQIRQPNGNVRLSQIGGQALRDIMFYDGGTYPAGPFTNTSTFHDTFAAMSFHRTPKPLLPRRAAEELTGLDDEVPIVFAHADLDQSNILISRTPEEPPRIKAIIDWHQSGWYPEHWDRLKAQSVGEYGSDWVDEYVPTIFPPPKFKYHYSWEYVRMAII